MEMNLTNKAVLITGGAKGVGREIALSFAKEGAKVAINYNSSEAEAQKCLLEVREQGAEGMAIRADISNMEEVDAMVSEVTRQWGPVDILINNAGYVKSQRFLESQIEDWEKQINVILYGAMYCTKAVLPEMVKRKCGCVINVIGESGRVGESRLVIVSTARSGIIGFTKALAKEVGRYGVRINGVSLGLVYTPSMSSHMDSSWLEKNQERILQLYPLRRLGKPKDIAPMVAFLASEHADWITGQVISISGGFTMI